MTMVDTVYWLPIYRRACGSSRLAWPKGRRPPGAVAPFLYSSREPSELSQWLCHDDSTINIFVLIIIIIIIINRYQPYFGVMYVK